MAKIVVITLAFIGVIVLALGLGALLAFPIMWLTNYLFTSSFLLAVFGIAKLTFWKAYWFSVFMSWMVKSTGTTTK